ncbi:MAG: AAA family ATPase [Kutzneria sp.]|nr:AAA family ATPase [Kutzneria sp.]
MTGHWSRPDTAGEDLTWQPLVGRADAMRTLDRALDRCVRGSFQLIELVGEPGVGKTRLLTEVGAVARDKHMVALFGRASEFERDAPLGVVADAMDDHLEQLGRRLTGRLDERDHRLLAAVFAGLTAATQAERMEIGTLRYQLYRAVRTLLEVLAESGGLVLVLDDMHWAEESSIELLEHLLRHPPHARIVIAVAYRPDQAPSRLTAALALTGGGRGVRIEVEPLTREQTDEFLGPGVNRTHRNWLYQASGGNPFYLEALSKMVTDQVPAPRRAPWDAASPTDLLTESRIDGVPSTVRAALLTELNRLTPTAQLVARAAAVVGDEFSAPAVAAAAAISEDDTLKALDELIARDVVRQEANRFRFRHPLVRHAAYASTLAGWRVATHARAAEYLRSQGAQPPMLANHVLRSASFGDMASVAVLAEAAATVGSSAPATAARWLSAAVRLLPDTRATLPTRLDLLTFLCGAQAFSGQLREGRDTAREVLALLPQEDRARRATAARMCATTERMVGSPEAAKAVLLDEIRRLPDPHDGEAAPLYLRLAVENLGTGDNAEAIDVLDELATMPLNRSTEFAAAALRPMPAYSAGDVPAALRNLDEAARLMDAASTADIAPWLDVTTWLCWAEVMAGRLDTALARLDRTTEMARATGQNYVTPYLLAAKAFAFGRLGRLTEAMALAEEATDIARLVDSGETLTMALTSQCLVLSWAGDYHAALRAGTEAGQLCATSRVWWSVLARCARGLVLIYSRDLEAGRAAVEAACDGFETWARDETMMLICLEALAHAEAAPGSSRRNADLAERAERIRHPEHKVNVALADLVRAHTLSGDDPGRSARLALRAADVLATANLRLEEGRARLRAGLSLATAGQADAGLAQLATSRDLFAECGAKGLQAQAAAACRRLGQRVPSPQGRRPKLPFGLSSRELQVARLVIGGYTNAQIAERFSLSLRTVETHLSHVFAKLGIPSRGALGRVLGPYLDHHDGG